MKYIKTFEAKNDINWELINAVEYNHRVDKVSFLLNKGDIKNIY
jgi:hypothetical protein